MSQKTYNQLWAVAQLELSHLLAEEMPTEPQRPVRDRVVFFQKLAMLYVRYIQIFRKLEVAYDLIVHPQKRRLIQRLLNGVIGRVLELKNEMVEKEFSEYHYVDDVLLDLKLTPSNLEIPIPCYFLTETNAEVKQRKEILAGILKTLVFTKSSDSLMVDDMSDEVAINIIQVAERARQRRLRAKLNEESRNMSWRHRMEASSLPEPAVAATRIQKRWRGYIQRKRTKVMREEENIYLGMTLDAKYLEPTPAEILAETNKVSIRVKRDEYEEAYQRSLLEITDRLRDVEGHEMSMTMKRQIQQWFFHCRNQTGLFPDYPSEEDGGSTLIFSDKTLPQLLEEIAAKEAEDPKSKSKGKKDKKDKKDKKKEKGKKDKKKKDKGNDDEDGLKMMPSAFLSELDEGHKIFLDFWRTRDETRNFRQKHEMELLKEERRKVIEAEIRLQVDVQMREELAELKLTVDKIKPGKAKAKKKKGSKSGKKKKKEKDLTADRTFESICEELVEQGLMKLADNVKLQDYLGDYNYLGTTLRQNDIEPMPSLSDVRQVLSLYAVLPLGSQVVHEKAPLIKSILLVGPEGVGKRMLVHAVCQETGACLFDLSPVNTAGKYPGKSGLAMMLHMVFKVARLVQPAVIWIGDAEKMFFKKVPKDQKELEPKRLKKDLPKSMKLIKGEDRVLVIGTTKNPLPAEIKTLCRMYNKILLIPKPDYGSRIILWKQIILKKGGKVTKAFDLSSLAKITDGYTPGHMVQVAQGVLTKRRVLQQAKKSLTAAELLPGLSKIEPVMKTEEEALKTWYGKTPLGKKRIKAAAEAKEEAAPSKGKKTQKGKK